jgi:hypothetical protein
MATSAISSVSGGYAQLLRTLPGNDSLAPENPAAGNAAPEDQARPEVGAAADPRAERDAGQSKIIDTSAILDEKTLTERQERLKSERTSDGRSLAERVHIASLQARDAEVRRHEAAHIAAGDGFVIGSATYAYQLGPDGRQYAVGGQVSIDTSPIPGKPEETVRKMRVVKTAALASGQPSGADLAIAAAAAQAEAAALAEIALARSREFASRYSGEMAAAAPPSSGNSPSVLRDDGPPPTPFDVIA